VSAFTKAEDKQLDVLIAHGLPLMCDSMVRALASPPYSFCASGVAGNATSLLQAVHNQPPDVAVIDSMLQDGTAGALSALREIARGFPKVRTVLVVDDSEQNLIVEAFRAGVAGVLHTQDSIQSAAECIRTVASGEMWAGKIELRALRDAISVTPRRGTHGECTGCADAVAVGCLSEGGLHASDNSIKMFPGKGDGTFAARLFFPANGGGQTPYQLALIDVNETVLQTSWCAMMR
jgi:PleD family two-component response regulator